MLRTRQILATASALVGLAVALPGCGQKGGLFLPTEAAAAHRATLPQSLRPDSPGASGKAASPAGTPASRPVAP